MSDSDLFHAVAHVTGEDSHEIRRRGFVLAGSKSPATLSRDGRGVWWRCPSLAAPTPVAFPVQRLRANTKTPPPIINIPSHSRTDGRS
jgi:hypothetical protein